MEVLRRLRHCFTRMGHSENCPVPSQIYPSFGTSKQLLFHKLHFPMFSIEPSSNVNLFHTVETPRATHPFNISAVSFDSLSGKYNDRLVPNICNFYLLSLDHHFQRATKNWIWNAPFGHLLDLLDPRQRPLHC